MDRSAAARVLGVDPGAAPRAVERAFRRRTRETHPDRFPPGSEAWEDATERMRDLVEARALLTGAPGYAGGAGSGGAGSGGAGSGGAGSGGAGSGGAGSGAGRTHRSEDGGTWAWARDAPTPHEDADRFPSPRDVDRRVRAWGLGWGGFLVLAALVSYLVGASQPTNDALPLWSPALAITGAVAIAIGLRAHRRLTRT